jgi:inosine-uridine nucleoside N-ribohydrolase
LLQESQDRVLIIAVGSMRDLAAAINRNPALFAAKVSKLVIFIGDAQGALKEYNVDLDPKAYACVMNSGLPIYWVPCAEIPQPGLYPPRRGTASQSTAVRWSGFRRISFASKA